jgi:serine/threonine protein kinase
VDLAEIHSLLDNPDGPFTRSESTLLKNSRTTTVAETALRVAGESVRVVFKRFNRKKWIDPLLTLVRPSRAWRSWQAGQHLASRGVPTPRNLIFLARRGKSWLNPLSWFLPRQTYLVTLKDKHVITLAEYVYKFLPTLDPALAKVQLRKLNLALARLIRALHERSLSHRDLKASNILVHLDSLESEEFLSLIDLVGVRLQNPVPARRRMQNLARLSISLAHVQGRTRTETLRFLRAYLPWGLSPLSDWKNVWRATEQAIAAKRARNRRRGRPLS